jgi:hypothetical protein
MSGEAHWDELRPMLEELADRIGRIEQFLAASGSRAAGSGSSLAGSGGTGDFFDSAPASFGQPPAFSNPDQIPAASAGMSPFGAPQPGGLPEDLLMLARSNRKIQAITEYRRRTGCSLKEAKDTIDRALWNS